MNHCGITIAGTSSGCGKTTAASGIMAALLKKGLKVQPFKAGPDYIDPKFHERILNVPSYNLDSCMLDDNTVKALFKRHSAKSDICVIEGVMGMYDGLGVKDIKGSTAEISALTNCPVILIVDGRGMSLSIAPLINGFCSFANKTYIKGVIINKIKSKGHYMLLKKIIEEHTNVKPLGYIPEKKDFVIKSRHLGLVQADEIKELEDKMERLTLQIEETVDIDGIIEISKEGRNNKIQENEKFNNLFSKKIDGKKIVISVAKDKAFSFYYKDNIELLEQLGAKIEYFSPIKDRKIPDNTDGLYFGGGYPEIYAKELEENTDIKNDIKTKIENGMYAYAECGGLMYMGRSIVDKNNNSFKMAGILNIESHMTGSLQRFGYVKCRLAKDCLFGRKGEEIKAHEFHYSKTIDYENYEKCYKISRLSSLRENEKWECGYMYKNLTAGYPHIHFYSNLSFAVNFVKNIMNKKYQRRSK